MKFVTFNIRCDFDQDGENSFCFRKPLILDVLRREQPDLIAFQEVLPHVAMWLRENLTDYYVLGCGRSEELKDEQVPVAFRKDRYELIDMHTCWLSGTPDVPGSRYPDQSVCPRVCTEVLLNELATGRVLRVVNTHLDHVGVEARRQGLAQILDNLRSRTLFPDAPVILTGDFNATPRSPELAVLDDDPAFTNATEGIGITFHGYMRAQHPGLIDYIYLKGPLACDGVEKWTDVKDGVYLSDHYPVCAQLRWTQA